MVVARYANPRRRWWRGLLLVTAIGAAAVTGGCSSDSAVGTGPTQVKCQVALAASSSSIAADGGTGTITVTTSPECPWEVSTSAGWLSGLSPTSGQGSGTVEFRAAPNPVASVREGDILVNEHRLRVSQQAAVCRVELRSGSLTVEAGGGTGEVAVSAPGGCAWSAATDASWIAFTTPATGSGDGSVGVSVAPHGGNQRRVGTIAIGDQRFTVTQEPSSAPPGCVYSISSASQGVVPSAGADLTASVAVASGCAWTATSSVAWITVVAGASGTGNGAVAFRVAANPGSGRSGTVTVAGQTFAVTQAEATATPTPTPTPTPSPCSYTIAPPEAEIASVGGTGSVAVSTTAGCTWTASSNAGWITVTSGASGTGNGATAFAVAANPGAARSGTMSVAGQTFTVTQAAATIPCTYAINPTSVRVNAKETNSTVAVSAGAGCTWTAQSNVPWIKVTSGASGSGNGAVAFKIEKNTSDDDRTGTLTIAGHIFTVRQDEDD
jgi:hypothetical protein